MRGRLLDVAAFVWMFAALFVLVGVAKLVGGAGGVALGVVLGGLWVWLGLMIGRRTNYI